MKILNRDSAFYEKTISFLSEFPNLQKIVKETELIDKENQGEESIILIKRKIDDLKEKYPKLYDNNVSLIIYDKLTLMQLDPQSYISKQVVFLELLKKADENKGFGKVEQERYQKSY